MAYSKDQLMLMYDKSVNQPGKKERTEAIAKMLDAQYPDWRPQLPTDNTDLAAQLLARAQDLNSNDAKPTT